MIDGDDVVVVAAMVRATTCPLFLQTDSTSVSEESGNSQYAPAPIIIVN